MPTLTINASGFAQLERQMKELEKQIPGAAVAAINRTLSSTFTQMKKEVTSKYNIKSSDISGGSKYKGESSNNLMKVTKANKNQLSAKITSRGSTLTLSRFLKRPTTPDRYKGKSALKRPGVVVMVKKERKNITTNNKAFVAKGKGGVIGIFKRRGKEMVMLRTASIPQMIGNKDILEKLRVSAIAKLQERIAHEIEYRINKAKAVR